jgi:hypothetical protein
VYFSRYTIVDRKNKRDGMRNRGYSDVRVCTFVNTWALCRAGGTTLLGITALRRFGAPARGALRHNRTEIYTRGVVGIRRYGDRTRPGADE